MTDFNTILIVDDNPNNLDLIRRYLEPEGYRVSAITSGEKALLLARNLQPQLILLDIMMPGMDGYQTCEALKQGPETKEIPVIFVTAKVAPEDLRKGFSVGCADYITKPVDQDILLARVSHQLSVLKKQKLERELYEQSQRMASLGEMVAEITHEVASPLGNVQLVVGAMKSELKRIENALAGGKLQKSDLESFIHQYSDAIETCEQNSVRAEQLMTSFKTVAVGQCHRQLSQFNLAELVIDVTHMCHPKLKRTRLEIEIDIVEQIEIRSYGGALTHVLTNLINNAIFHGFDPEQNGTIKLSATLEDEHLIITVADNGKGIPDDILPKIFDKYFTTKPRQGGSGLGLNICKDMVENELNGNIIAKSQIGQGSQFIIRIPKTLEA